MSEFHIPFNRPYMTGRELFNIAEANFRGKLAGDGLFTNRCHAMLEKQLGCRKALLTHSCTAALEMAALLLDVQPGDEFIMPSYTFVSTANAFVLRGGVPVFIDIRQDTLNIDESHIEAAITPRTKAIVVVHYAGVGCEMDAIMDIANRHGLRVVEDAAQGIQSTYKGMHLGSIGDIGALSFHETKNITSGEGGALLLNDSNLIARAEILREKGTDRSSFFKGEIGKYTWQDIGSSYLPGEMVAAFLSAQLAAATEITEMRLKVWDKYHHALKPLESEKLLRRPIIPIDCTHNAHMYYVLLATEIDRKTVISELNRRGIGAVFHYIPLHSSPAGRKFGRSLGSLDVTNSVSSTLLRLPMWVELTDEDVYRVVNELTEILQK